MKFDASSVGGKAPRDGTLMGIALGLQGGNTLLQDVYALHPGRQAASCKDSDLDIGHVEPGFHVWTCNGTRRAAGCAVLQQGRLRLFPFEAEKRNTSLILYGNMNYLSLSNADGDKYPAREMFRPTFGG